ncbi:hypothetical protein OG245_34770 [Streptomyces sp. NBC_01116]|uniref:hypothetical protein n=1 Tax=Streptomyces sp. NBC_01116 TaxID=2903752 RepID=UPI00325129C8
MHARLRRSDRPEHADNGTRPVAGKEADLAATGTNGGTAAIAGVATALIVTGAGAAAVPT